MLIKNSTKKYRHFILRGFPKDKKFELLEKDLGDTLNKNVFKLIRMQKDGQPTTSVRIIWSSHDETPLNELVLYMDTTTGEPASTSTEEFEPRPVTYYDCKEVGHIKK